MLIRVLLLTDHPAHTFVDQQLLVRLEVSQICGKVGDDCLDKGFGITVINLHEHLLSKLCNLQVGLAGHVLNTWVALVHKFVQFVHDCLEEGPVVDKEAGELADNVHDVGGDEGLGVLSHRLLAEIEELLDDSAEELVFPINIHAPRDGS